MSIRRTEIDTSMLNLSLGMEFNVPVFYTDELVETSAFDFAFSSVTGGVLPYLFVGYFSDGKDFNKWFFSNARRHEEMRQAIEQDIGQGYNYIYGQIWFSDSDQRQGKFRFDRLVLNEKLPDLKKAKDLLLKAINPNRIHPQFEIRQARY